MDDSETTAVQNADEVQTSVSTPPVDETQTPSEVSEVQAESAPNELATEDGYKSPEALPDEQSEQAKAFQQFRRENKKLKEELDQLKSHVDGRKTRQSLFELTQGAPSNVDSTIDYKLDERLAMRDFPQLDPKSQNHNPDFEEEVASRYFFDLYRGKNTSVLEIAKRVLPKYQPKPDTRKIEQETAQRVKTQLTVKEQASLSASGRSQPAFRSEQERTELVNRSRQGDNWAIAERIKRAGF